MSWDKGLDVLWVNLEHRVSWTLHGTPCYRTERNAAATAPSPLVAISFSDLWFNTRRLRRCWRLQIKDMDLLFTLCVISPNNLSLSCQPHNNGSDRVLQPIYNNYIASYWTWRGGWMVVAYRKTAALPNLSLAFLPWLTVTPPSLSAKHRDVIPRIDPSHNKALRHRKWTQKSQGKQNLKIG